MTVPNRSRSLLALAAFTALAAAPAWSSAQTVIGVNAAIRNSVQMKTTSDPALRPAVLRGPAHLGDLVVSGPQSTLQVLLRDKSVFTVGANARMTLDRFVYDPNRGTSEVAAAVATGAFRFMSGRSLQGAHRTVISTPVASIGVRGTIVEGVAGPQTSDVLAGEAGLPKPSGDTQDATLVVLNGPGKHSQGFDKPGAIDVTANGATVAVEHPGQAVLIWGPNQAPFGPFTLSEAALDRLNALLLPGAGPNPEAGASIASAAVASGEILGTGDLDPAVTYDPAGVEVPVQIPNLDPRKGDF